MDLVLSEGFLAALRRYHPTKDKRVLDPGVLRDIVREATGVEPERDPVHFTLNVPALVVREAAGEAGAGRRMIRATTSSTDVDLYGTRMALSALRSMRDTAKDRLTIFMNHVYTVPESVAGTVTNAYLVERTDPAGNRFVDLDLEIDMLPEGVNPRVDQLFKQLEAKVKLGLSIGALITAYEFQDPNGKVVEDADVFEVMYGGNPDNLTLVITDVLLIESSVVGVPANRRSWIAEARRGLINAGIVPVNPKDRFSQPQGGPKTMKGKHNEDVSTRGTALGGLHTAALDDAGLADLDAALAGSAAEGPGGDAERSVRIDPADDGVEPDTSAPDVIFEGVADASTEDEDEPETALAGLSLSDLERGLAEPPTANAEVAPKPTVRLVQPDELVPATETPATGTPATGTPATGTPATGTRATETPAAQNPLATTGDEAAAIIELAAVLRTMTPDAERGYTTRQKAVMANAHDRAAHVLGMQCCGMDGCGGHSMDRDMSVRNMSHSAKHLTYVHDTMAREMGMACGPAGANDGDEDDIRKAAAAPATRSATGEGDQSTVLFRLALPSGMHHLCLGDDGTLRLLAAPEGVTTDAVPELSLGLSEATLCAATADLAKQAVDLRTATALMEAERKAATDIAEKLERKLADLEAERAVALRELGQFNTVIADLQKRGLYRPTTDGGSAAEDQEIRRSLAAHEQSERSLHARNLDERLNREHADRTEQDVIAARRGAGSGHPSLDLPFEFSADGSELSMDQLVSMSDAEVEALYTQHYAAR